MSVIVIVRELCVMVIMVHVHADGRRGAAAAGRELRGGEDDESVWRWDGFWDNESLVCPSGVRRQGEARVSDYFVCLASGFLVRLRADVAEDALDS